MLLFSQLQCGAQCGGLSCHGVRTRLICVPHHPPEPDSTEYQHEGCWTVQAACYSDLFVSVHAHMLHCIMLILCTGVSTFAQDSVFNTTIVTLQHAVHFS